MKKKKDVYGNHFEQKLILVILLIVFVVVVCFYWFYPKFEYNPQKASLFNVTRVIDGDTFELESGERVRLICVDTPEANEPGYHKSKQFLVDLIESKAVRLEKDKSEKDKYDRFLMYVYITDGDEEIFVNKEIVKQGYGEIMKVEPDIKYCDNIAAE
ncbi:nuclease [Candidatus Pacearchaeota archaeon]|nr:nuclease [Candidatus Pacearchaeota archaeon]